MGPVVLEKINMWKGLRQQLWRWTTDTFWSEKLTSAFGSVELKSDLQKWFLMTLKISWQLLKARTLRKKCDFNPFWHYLKTKGDRVKGSPSYSSFRTLYTNSLFHSCSWRIRWNWVWTYFTAQFNFKYWKILKETCILILNQDRFEFQQSSKHSENETNNGPIHTITNNKFNIHNFLRFIFTIRPWKKYMAKFGGHTVNKWWCRNVDTLYLILKDKQGEVLILRTINMLHLRTKNKTVSMYRKYSEIRHVKTKQKDSPSFLAINTSVDLSNI